MSDSVHNQIETIVNSKPVVLFMKGTRSFPQCGFSATVVQILGGLVDEFETVNVLSDPQVRAGIKEYSQWPTIPQLYVGGEFVGGCDIVRELHQSGDLHKMLGVDPSSLVAPSITISERAAAEFGAAMGEMQDGEKIHLSVNSRFVADLKIAPAGGGELESSSNGITILFDAASARRAEGLTIDFEETAEGAGFRIDMPQAPPAIREMSSAELKAKLDSGESLELIDVRTEEERARAAIGGRLLSDELARELGEADKETVLVFYCHHGQRSRAAAQGFIDQGFRRVYNLSGGIDGWSQQVDPSVPRY